MVKKKVYLETTLFNFYFEENKKIDHINTVKLFEEIAAGKYEAFTSTYVIDELKKARNKEKRDKMLSLIGKYGITILRPNHEVITMAGIYTEEGVIKQKYKMDRLHIAIAAVHRLDMIVSMNFDHIVKRKTKIMTSHINVQKGYRAVKICSPKEVMENDKEVTSDRERDQ